MMGYGKKAVRQAGINFSFPKLHIHDTINVDSATYVAR